MEASGYPVTARHSTKGQTLRDDPLTSGTRHDRSPLPQPQAIRCEDGGYVIDPTSISSSPIRAFTRLDDLEPEERVQYQNQFRTKGARGKGKQQLLFQQRATEMDSFDRLRGERSRKKLCVL